MQKLSCLPFSVLGMAGTSKARNGQTSTPFSEPGLNRRHTTRAP